MSRKTLADELQDSRKESEDLRFEKFCLWALVGLMAVFALHHMAVYHAAI